MTLATNPLESLSLSTRHNTQTTHSSALDTQTTTTFAPDSSSPRNDPTHPALSIQPSCAHAHTFAQLVNVPGLENSRPIEGNSQTGIIRLSKSRKRSAAHMMDLDKVARPSEHANGQNTDPEDMEMTHPAHHLEHHHVHDDEMSTAQRLYEVTLDSPSSPGAYKRMRSSADSDAGSSSCKDVDDPDVLAPDSVPALLHQIRQLLDYVASKPTLQNGSASFVRDYLRTMLIQNSIAAEEAIQLATKHHRADVAAGRKKQNQYFKLIPDDLAKHIFSFLDGQHLARSREVCRRWNDFACEEPLWKSLCLRKWRSLETDKALWKLIDKTIDPEAPNRWRQIFPRVNRSLQWNCRLQKTGRFICNLVAHHISGAPLGETGIPSILVVERRFNILHLQTFVRPDASILYFEPEAESDRSGFVDFIEYLNKRTRAGLALEGQLRFIFIPPCDYTRNHVEYQGESLLGVVQNAYPHVPE